MNKPLEAPAFISTDELMALLADKQECFVAAYRLSQLPLNRQLDVLHVLYTLIDEIEAVPGRGSVALTA